MEEEFFVRGACIDLAVRSLNLNPNDPQAWAVIRWALKDLQQLLDGADELKQTIQEILPILETTRGTS
jgi:hypothetical protein